MPFPPVHKALKDPPDHKGQQAQKGLKARKDPKVIRVAHRDRKGRKAPKDPPVHKARPAR